MPQTPRIALPPYLVRTAFTVAQGMSVGLGQGRLRGSDLDRPFHGIRIRSDRSTANESSDGHAARGRFESAHDSDLAAVHAVLATRDPDLIRRCTALLVALPDGSFFSHLTAARLWPLALPQADLGEPVHVSVRPPGRPPRRSGVAGHLVTDPLARVLRRGGLRTVDPATLFCQLGTSLPLPDLVAVGDALVLRPAYPEPGADRPWVSLDQLSERVDMYRGRGKTKARKAFTLIRPGAESRPETLLRLAIVEAGLPEPEVNPTMRGAPMRPLGRGDLVYRRWRVLVEYDGDHHRRSKRQFERDIARLDDFTADGWRVVRITGTSFFLDRQGAIARVARALTERGWRP